jgi:hypothetical protein
MVTRLVCAVVLVVGCMPTDAEQQSADAAVDDKTSERRPSPNDDAGPRGSEESREGEQTADGGVSVVRGPTGPTGPEGPPGPPGPPGEGAVNPETGEPCEWCWAGQLSCNADGARLQECADDGDGCGHWEVREECAGRCGLGLDVLETDDLGNQRTTQEPRCFDVGECGPFVGCPPGETCAEGWCEVVPPVTPLPDPDSKSCLETVACDEGERCSAGGECVESDSWLTAEALIETPDGLRHHFVALGEASQLVRCSVAVETYWNVTPGSGCTLTLNPDRWTQSDLGEDYLGNVLVSTGVNWPVTEVGSFEPTVCSLAQLSNANKLVVSNQICELTIEGLELDEGGHIFGTFAGRSVITAVDNPGEQGFVEVTGAFQVQL